MKSIFGCDVIDIAEKFLGLTSALYCYDVFLL